MQLSDGLSPGLPGFEKKEAAFISESDGTARSL